MKAKVIVVDCPYGWHYRAIDKNRRYTEGWMRCGENSRNKVESRLLEKYAIVLELESDWVSPIFARSKDEPKVRGDFSGDLFIESESGDAYMWEVQP